MNKFRKNDVVMVWVPQLLEWYLGIVQGKSGPWYYILVTTDTIWPIDPFKETMIKIGEL